jgi:hypothetical protein
MAPGLVLCSVRITFTHKRKRGTDQSPTRLVSSKSLYANAEPYLAPTAPSPTCAAAGGAPATTSPAAATPNSAATASAATATSAAADHNGGHLQVAANVFLVKEMERRKADVGHFLFAKNDTLIGRGTVK